MSSNLPWQPDDDSPWPVIACLNFGGDMATYSRGFREGAEALLALMKTGTVTQDHLVYPFVYDMRHAVELALKQVTREASRYLDDLPDFADGHDLSNLWSVCRPLLLRIWPNDAAAFKQVQRVVTSLRAIDPNGEGFRYPITTKSKKTGGKRAPTLDPGLRRLDLQKMYDDVIEALDLLDGADSAIDAYLDSKADYREIQEEMRREYEEEMRREYEEEMRREYEDDMRREFEDEAREYEDDMRREYAAEMAEDMRYENES